jgi:RNA polymerase sigma-70 factor (ECF subfamily)
MPANEGELVRRAQEGDADAFAALVTEHQRFVYNLALRALGDAHEAEEVAQDAFVRAWLALPRFRRQAQFRTGGRQSFARTCRRALQTHG